MKRILIIFIALFLTIVSSVTGTGAYYSTRAYNNNYSIDIKFGNLYGVAQNTKYKVKLFSETLQTTEGKINDEVLRVGFLRKEVDLTAPNISITSPSDGASVPGLNVEFAYNATDNVQIRTIIYDIDGTNYTDTNADGSIIQYLNFDNHNITVYAIDLRNNTAYDKISFSNYAVTSGATQGGSTSSWSAGGRVDEEEEPIECNIQLVRPTGKIFPIGSPGEKSPFYEVVVRNTFPRKDTFHFAVVGDVDCELQNTDLEINGNSTSTNTIRCVFSDKRKEGKLVIENMLCDTSLPIVVDSSKVGALVSKALTNPLFIVGGIIGMILLIFGLTSLGKLFSG